MSIIEKIKSNELFKGIDDEKFKMIHENIRYYNKEYKKNQIIASEGEECNSLGIVLNGTIEIERTYSSGKYVVLKRLKDGEVFGEAIVFSDKNKYPATVLAISDCNILYVKKEDIIKLCLMEENILKNFVSLLSNKIFVLNRNIKNASFKTVREKVVNYILEQSRVQKSEKIKFKMTKEEIAALIGIPRPSLSRELIKLRDDKLINFDRTNLTIINLQDLEDELIN